MEKPTPHLIGENFKRALQERQIREVVTILPYNQLVEIRDGECYPVNEDWAIEYLYDQSTEKELVVGNDLKVLAAKVSGKNKKALEIAKNLEGPLRIVKLYRISSNNLINNNNDEDIWNY